MPAELLEKPVTSPDILKPVANAVPQSRDQGAATQPPKSLLRKIFEGHEEFLGRTPD
jgi:hypothetical protein